MEPDQSSPVNFDQDPFITQGLGRAGQKVAYYNFDVRSTIPAPIYVLFREGEANPVAGQFNIVDVLPGEAGYNDFWQVIKVMVPSNYIANQVASYDEIQSAKYKLEATTTIVNCPVVPYGSTATKRLGGGSADLTKGWYDKKVVFYFNFEKTLATSGGNVPLSTIFVSFNINPDQTGGGPVSGFVVENGTMQTHNVVATLPLDSGYSSLWVVDAYDNANFDSVSNLTTATSATSKGSGLAMVNCPIVTIQ